MTKPDSPQVPPLDAETLLTLTADIVAAHVGNNRVNISDLPVLLTNVYRSLAEVGSDRPTVEDKREPAISIRASVKADHITCLECGAKLKMLKRHLDTHHQLDMDTYRARWNLPADYPMVAANYAQKRRELAKQIGLGRKPAPIIAPPPEAKVEKPKRSRRKATAE